METLTNTHTLGEPQLAGPLAVLAVFGPPPRLSYRSFVHAIELGALVKEIDSGAVVGRLSVSNPTDLPLLLYEGEEVLGAQQNRTFDASVLVAAGESLELLVSCVERGRWDGSRHRKSLRPSPQLSDPELRRLKRTRINSVGHADQSEVWQEVDARLDHHRVASPSAALSDVYERRRDDLGPLARAIRLHDGQVGALACVAGSPTALDLVSRADVFASLLAPLAQGYALDALGAPERPVDRDAAEQFLRAALSAPRSPCATPGRGHGFAVSVGALVGAGLEHDEELLQLSAFPAEGGSDR